MAFGNLRSWLAKSRRTIRHLRLGGAQRLGQWKSFGRSPRHLGYLKGPAIGTSSFFLLERPQILLLLRTVDEMKLSEDGLKKLIDYVKRQAKSRREKIDDSDRRSD
jgi:hypothetical protein